MSTDYLHKANEDYSTRTETPRSVVSHDTTFVFVTPRRWNRAAPTLNDWQQEKRAEGVWKDVRVIDAVALEEWLDHHPAVACRFARYVLNLIPPVGARSTDEFWDEYSAGFKPALTEDVLLCAREKQAEALLQRLATGPQAILQSTDSPDEVIAFAVAAIRRAEPDTRKFLESRTLILDTEEAARQLARRANMTFIPRGQALKLDGMLAQSNPTIVPLGRDTLRGQEATVLNRPTTNDLGKAIATMGFDTAKAHQLARECGRSVTILARRIPGAAASKPEWADGRRTLIPALLAGGWSMIKGS